MWPDHGHDVAAAVAWVQTEGGAVGLDPDHAQLLDATGYSHEDVSSQLGAAGETLVTPSVTDFVRSRLAG